MLTFTASLLLLRLVLLGGLGLWTAIAVINNLIAASSATGAIGRTMGTTLLGEPPEVATPLRRRAIANRAWHRAAYVLLLAIQSVAGALLLIAAAATAAAMVGGVSPDDVIPWANLAVAAFLGMAFLLLLGGSWFGYWIKQEGLQLTHLALLILGGVVSVVVNIPVR